MNRLWMSDFFSPSFHIARIGNKMLKVLRPSHEPFLVRVAVPSRGYSYYCGIADFAPGREEVVLQRFKPAEGDIVVDVGAHVGRYTLLSSKFIGKDGTVIALEPDPRNYRLLQRNMQLNKCANVLALNCAAYSDDVEGFRLFVPGKDHGYTIYNTLMEQRTTTDDFVTVNTVTLDAIFQKYFPSHDGVNWIKIDVEGAEFEVLKGASLLLSQSRNISVLIEIHNLRHGNYYGEIADLMARKGFKKTFEKVYDNGEMHVIFHKDEGSPVPRDV